MNTEDTIREIKQELRAAMNGVASARMREAGLNYHVNFGIELPRLQLIASEFEPNHQLAQQLWHENVRESKILAAMLMPIDKFSDDLADVWVEQIPNAEIAQTTVMYLFQRLPFASQLVFLWLASDNETKQLCALLLATRMIIQGTVFNERSLQELTDQAQSLAASPNLHIRKAVLNLEQRLKIV